MEVIYHVLNWGSPLGLGLFFFLFGAGVGLFFWGLAKFISSQHK